MNVTKKAHELRNAGIATTWSQAMKLAVSFIRTMNKINEGKATNLFTLAVMSEFTAFTFTVSFCSLLVEPRTDAE